MKTIIILLVSLISFVSYAQVSTLQLQLVEGIGYRKPLKEVNVKVIVNDTLVSHLITDPKGVTGFIEVPDGEYTLAVKVESYKDYLIKSIKVDGARSKHLKIKMEKN
ncbi:MAG: carboxypeptidase regulatory-like domain-containing protein [Bacteroidetes bacterium]|nr:carboxypeptidase regulatory-like domain-containing protein [Bacteroidota bacterium]